MIHDMSDEILLAGFTPEDVTPEPPNFYKFEIVRMAINALRANGISFDMPNPQNGQLNCRTRHGVIVSYYPTTGTIAGYDDLRGLDDLIKLCLEG